MTLSCKAQGSHGRLMLSRVFNILLRASKKLASTTRPVNFFSDQSWLLSVFSWSMLVFMQVDFRLQKAMCGAIFLNPFSTLLLDKSTFRVSHWTWRWLCRLDSHSGTGVIDVACHGSFNLSDRNLNSDPHACTRNISTSQSEFVQFW